MSVSSNAIQAFGYLTDAPSDGNQYARKNGAWEIVSSSGGTTDHGSLTGLSDDDHPQYHNDARGDARYYTQSQVDSFLGNKSDVGHTHVEADITDLGNYEPAFSKNTAFNKNFGTVAGTVAEGDHTHSNYLTDAPSDGNLYGRKDGVWSIVSQGVSDHGALSGLSDDDHPQYHNDARGDARYYTQTQVDSFLNNKSDVGHTHVEADITDLGNYEPAFSKNTAFNKNFGTSAGTVAEGNHTHSNYLTDAPSDGNQYARQNGAWTIVSSSGGTTDHGSLSGLSDDDHPQYHNDARGDARYLKLDGSTVGATTQDQVFTNAVKAGGFKTGQYTGATFTFRAYVGLQAKDIYVNNGLITGHS